ncbi:MAG: hypothetical protein AB1430_12875 [Pseudomonadota bacterium]
MSQRYAKTDAGRDEIKSKSRKLSRHARNLLLIVDETHPLENWVQLVQGATEADAQQLVAAGLIAARAEAAAPRPAARPSMSLAQALERLSYDQIYGLITSQARDRVGLIRGYKLILDVEKCASIEELRSLAQRFLAMVAEQQGDTAARQMRQALGAA